MHYIENYFVYRENLKGNNTDYLYNKYVNEAINTEDRYAFCMLMMRVIANLKNSHSNYFDNKIYLKFGGHLGFYASYDDHKRVWVVTKSAMKNIMIGDIVKSVDNEPVETFFSKKKEYINASNERQARNHLFFLPWLFRYGSEIKMDTGKVVIVKKKAGDFDESPSHILIDGRVPYIKIPSFWHGYHKKISRYVHRYGDYKNIIIDLRGNVGGDTPRSIIKYLMNKSYRYPNYYIIRSKGALAVKVAKNEGQKYVIQKSVSKYKTPINDAYKGRLFILADENTVSAGEDFLMPFKDNKRAMILGSQTYGSDGDVYEYKFENGILIWIGAVRVEFPDGSKFEGRGIKPDITIRPSIKDIKEKRDVVLEKALKIIKR